MEMEQLFSQETDTLPENSNTTSKQLKSELTYQSQFHFQCSHSQEERVVSEVWAISTEKVQYHSTL